MIFLKIQRETTVKFIFASSNPYSQPESYGYREKFSTERLCLSAHLTEAFHLRDQEGACQGILELEAMFWGKRGGRSDQGLSQDS